MELQTRNVTIIPARTYLHRSHTEEKPKCRVAAYCRVSTDSDEQATSYETQIEHYTTYIHNHPDWKLAGIYADDGISGTNTKKRDEFNRMIEDCMAGTIDMIITKSISRFARNTLDCLKYIRQLKDKHIPVFFEKENINTMDSKGEVLLTIMASLAQQESQSLSQNVKLGLQYRYQRGEVQINCNHFLGYAKDENKHMVIVPEEAEIVKRIYREYLECASMLKIARNLTADGLKNGAGHTKWRDSNIRQILQNEKYMGDALLQKTYTVDFLTKKRVKNTGIMPQYYVKDNHEAIIPRDIFLQVQEEMVRRSSIHLKNGRKLTYSSNHCFSQRIRCGKCGEIFRRIHWNNRGKKSIVWRCVNRVDNTGKCDARTISESALEQVCLTAINQVLCEKKDFLTMLQHNIETVLSHNNDKTLAAIDIRLEELQTQLVKLASSKAGYDDVAEEIYHLREQKQQALAKNANQDEIRSRIENMATFLKTTSTAITQFDDYLVRQLIKTITVFEDSCTVEFKSGVTVDVEK